MSVAVQDGGLCGASKSVAKASCRIKVKVSKNVLKKVQFDASVLVSTRDLQLMMTRDVVSCIMGTVCCLATDSPRFFFLKKCVPHLLKCSNKT